MAARYKDRDILVGNDHLLHHESVAHDRCTFDNTVAHIVVDGRYAGFITIGDQIRPDARQAVQTLRDQGVEHVAMLTGDNACVAQAVADKLSLDSFQADLLPEDKVAALERFAQSHPHGKIAFVGDGINDAPVIARADVGLAMGALGSDAAVETADVVLMRDTPRQNGRSGGHRQADPGHRMAEHHPGLCGGKAFLSPSVLSAWPPCGKRCLPIWERPCWPWPTPRASCEAERPRPRSAGQAQRPTRSGCVRS